MTRDLAEQRRRYVRTILAWHDHDQANLAAVIGCTQSNASRKLAGKRALTPDELLAIATSYNVDPGLMLQPPDLDSYLGAEAVRETAGGLVRSTFRKPRCSAAKRHSRNRFQLSGCALVSSPT